MFVIIDKRYGKYVNKKNKFIPSDTLRSLTASL